MLMSPVRAAAAMRLQVQVEMRLEVMVEQAEARPAVMAEPEALLTVVTAVR